VIRSRLAAWRATVAAGRQQVQDEARVLDAAWRQAADECTWQAQIQRGDEQAAVEQAAWQRPEVRAAGRRYAQVSAWRRELQAVAAQPANWAARRQLDTITGAQDRAGTAFTLALQQARRDIAATRQPGREAGQ
jgi:hypothetical protein